MKRILSFFLIGLFLASTIGAGVCMAKSNHYDYKVVGEDGTSYEITGKFGNYNPSQDNSNNRVTVYNADIYDSEGNYVGKADVVNWNSKSNNGAHIKWHVEEATPIGNATVEEVANTTEPVANVTDEVNITEEVVNNTTEVINITEEVTPEPVANTTDDNDVIGSGSIEIDDNGTIINGSAVIPDDGHMCDNIPLSQTNVTHNDGVSKVANHNPAVKVGNDNATVKVVNGTCNCTKAVNHTVSHNCTCKCNCNCTHIVNVFIINEFVHGHIIHDLLVFIIGALIVVMVYLYRRFRR